MRRHHAPIDAVVDYSACSMKYAYKHIHKLDVPTIKTKIYWERMVDRAVKSVAREKLRLGTVSLSRAMLLWQVYSKDTIIEQKPKLNSAGRHIVSTFREWIESVNVVGLAVPRAIPIQIRDKEILELSTVADLAYNDGQVRLLRITTTPSRLETAILAEDQTPWTIFHPTKTTWHDVTKSTWIAKALQQISSGLFREAVWPNPDGRCVRCPYANVCSYEDVGSTTEEIKERLNLGGTDE